MFTSDYVCLCKYGVMVYAGDTRLLIVKLFYHCINTFPYLAVSRVLWIDFPFRSQ